VSDILGEGAGSVKRAPRRPAAPHRHDALVHERKVLVKRLQHVHSDALAAHGRQQDGLRVRVRVLVRLQPRRERCLDGVAAHGTEQEGREAAHLAREAASGGGGCVGAYGRLRPSRRRLEACRRQWRRGGGGIQVRLARGASALRARALRGPSGGSPARCPVPRYPPR
jgi:hypothetical protein